ncbi:MAG: methyltransferase domain-containing protein [Paludibacter sp.]|jgi:hypothetical protein|nr:class I SAM-dependent methyltransferase [Bacteroidales bacterium]
MKYSEKINKYLKGEEFSNSLEISFAGLLEDKSRNQKLIEICSNKRVIHFGCADHIELIDQKIAANRWLHKLLVENTSDCIGIDIDKKAVDYITNTLRYKQVYCLDIENEKPDFLQANQQWDYLILGEIIEHVDNPVLFLQRIMSVFKDRVNQIIITAPNVFNVSTQNDISYCRENINTDHNYWFSPYTLNRIVYKSGFSNIEFTFADRVALSFKNKLKYVLQRIFGKSVMFQSNQFNTIILTADF